VLKMKYPTRIYYTETDKALMWDRWQNGESLNSIARHFGRSHSSYYRELVLSASSSRSGITRKWSALQRLRTSLSINEGIVGVHIKVKRIYWMY